MVKYRTNNQRILGSNHTSRALKFGQHCLQRMVVVAEHSSSAVEFRTRNHVRLESTFATVSKFGHFRSLHDAPLFSAV